MNRDEAQFILGAYRPNSEDAHDPQFQEALELARRDPVLERWFVVQQDLDRAFSAKIRGRPVPADLKAQLLLARATARRTSRWRRPLWLAVAACFAIIFVAAGSLLWRRNTSADFGAFRGAMVAASADMADHADVWGFEAGAYRKWIAANRGTSDFVLPASLADKDIAACKIVEWKGRRVTMLCLKVGAGHLDVFVIDASELPGISIDSSPQFFADNRADTTSAAWQREGKVYFLTGAMSKAELQRLL